MIILPQAECRTNLMRGRLKHSWLENQLLNKTSDEIAYLWSDTGWTALDKEFSERVKETVRLADDLEDGFSPAQLVDQLTPFTEIDQETRDSIKQAVHAVYLESSKIADLKAPLREDATALGEALDELHEVWALPVTEDNDRILRSAWQKVSTRAKSLHMILERLPKGIVLP